MELNEYQTRGEYHKNLDKNWSYYTYYIKKMGFVKSFLNNLPKESKILDIGCGEGVLVEEFSKKGLDIKGIDKNFSSKYVIKQDILNNNLKDNTFDVILCLDVIEHLYLEDQEILLLEIKRLLKNKGRVLFSIPNMATLKSRILYFLKGDLARTDIKKHKGERPIAESLSMLKEHNFKIKYRKGLQYFKRYPFLNSTIMGFPNLCFINILICEVNKTQ